MPGYRTLRAGHAERPLRARLARRPLPAQWLRPGGARRAALSSGRPGSTRYKGSTIPRSYPAQGGNGDGQVSAPGHSTSGPLGSSRHGDHVAARAASSITLTAEPWLPRHVRSVSRAEPAAPINHPWALPVASRPVGSGSGRARPPILPVRPAIFPTPGPSPRPARETESRGPPSAPRALAGHPVPGLGDHHRGRRLPVGYRNLPPPTRACTGDPGPPPRVTAPPHALAPVFSTGR